MPASPVSKRAALEKKFEDYVLTYGKGPGFGLFPIASSAMASIEGNAGREAAGSNTAVYTLPFSFPFEDKSYNRVTVSTNGWLILRAPDSNTNAINDVLSSVEGTASANDLTAEVADTFDKESVFLCPWWSDLMNSFDTLERATKLASNSAISTSLTYISSGSTSWQAGSQARLIRDGIIAPESIGKYGLNKGFGGIKTYDGNSSPYGRYCVFRWSSFLGDSVEKDVAQFDVVLYENGVIEFRYGPVYNVPEGATNIATVGIFAYGGEANNPRYRDFSVELSGSADLDSRGRYVNGGSVYDGTYEVSTPIGTVPALSGTVGPRKYCVQLTADKNWPGGRTYGGIFTFSPPLRRKRQTRSSIRNLNSFSFIENQDSLFDDNKSVVFAKQLVEFPSMMPLSLKLDSNSQIPRAYTTLFASGSISASITASTLFDDPLIVNLADYGRRATSGVDAFNEENRFELNNHNDSFFASGSSIELGQEPGYFSQPLDAKAQFRLSFPVNKSVSMLGNTSSIYYFNRSRSMWNIPTKSFVDHVGPLDKFSARFRDSQLRNKGSRFIEDAKGFDAYGFCVVSGTLDTVRNIPSTSPITASQSSLRLGAGFEPADQIDTMTDEYLKSVQRNVDYDANEETFTLPIDKPFLFEKAVFEIPVALGRSWFSDKTITVVTGCIVSDGTLLHAGSVISPDLNKYARVQDEGGPALTVSLMCQKNYGTSSIRDLISKSVVTHEEDTTRQITFDFSAPGLDLGNLVRNNAEYPGIEYERQYRCHMLGMPEEVPVSLIVKKDANDQFTGSIAVKSSAAATNGVKLYFSYDAARINASVKNDAIRSCLTASRQFMSQEFLTLDQLSEKNSKSGSFNTTGIDPYGRGITGFAPSGGSIFGREHSAIDFGKSVKNPFYISSSSERESKLLSWENSFTADNRMTANSGGNWSAGITFNTSIFLTGSQDSPYLINPGEKLVLAISKTRPALKSFILDVLDTSSNTKGEVSMLSSSYYNDIGNEAGHDVTLMTGSINITVYGSYVQANRGYYG